VIRHLDRSDVAAEQALERLAEIAALLEQVRQGINEVRHLAYRMKEGDDVDPS
jgi:hypothetical protein